MDGIINGMKIIFNSITGKLESEIESHLQDNDIQLNDAQLAMIRGTFENATNSFEKLGTRYQQDKYIHEHLNHLVRKFLKCLRIVYKKASDFRLRLNVCWVEGTQKTVMKKYTAVMMSP